MTEEKPSISIPFTTFRQIEFWAWQIQGFGVEMDAQTGVMREHLALDFAAPGVPERFFRGVVATRPGPDRGPVFNPPAQAAAATGPNSHPQVQPRRRRAAHLGHGHQSDTDGELDS